MYGGLTLANKKHKKTAKVGKRKSIPQEPLGSNLPALLTRVDNLALSKASLDTKSKRRSLSKSLQDVSDELLTIDLSQVSLNTLAEMTEEEAAALPLPVGALLLLKASFPPPNGTPRRGKGPNGTPQPKSGAKRRERDTEPTSSQPHLVTLTRGDILSRVIMDKAVGGHLGFARLVHERIEGLPARPGPIQQEPEALEIVMVTAKTSPAIPDQDKPVDDKDKDSGSGVATLEEDAEQGDQPSPPAFSSPEGPEPLPESVDQNSRDSQDPEEVP